VTPTYFENGILFESFITHIYIPIGWKGGGHESDEIQLVDEKGKFFFKKEIPHI